MGARRGALGALLGMALCACAPTGLIYSNVTVPLDVNFDATPVVRSADDGDIRTLQYYVRFDWGDASIGTIAREHGFETVYYADLRTLSVLGIWTQQFVTIYGVQVRH